MSNLDKSSWLRVKFGDVVRQVKDVVDPRTCGLERYVAGEHMDTDDLRIRRWGTISDGYLGPAFHMRFKPGQVLYGSRRTYLRKVAMPDFEGICANTTFVLEPKDQRVLIPELLPFVMQTEAFHDHSIRQSKGSVNPYVNFSDLAWHEFALPPAEQQQLIAETMLSIECQQESLTDAMLKTGLLRHAIEKESFVANGRHPVIFLGELLRRGTVSFQTGPFGTVLQASSYRDSGYPVINPSDMVDGQILLDSCKFVDQGEWKRLHRYQVQTGDVLIGRKGDMQNIVFVVPEYSSYLMGSDCIRFRINDDTLVAQYLFYYLRAEVTRQWLQAQAYGTTMPGINEKLLARMLIHVPNHQAQLDVVSDIYSVDCCRRDLIARRSKSITLKKAILSTM